MRDAFGGVFMIRLLLVFIVIYVSFTAVSFNYARAFRVKNKVIDYIEKQDNEFISSSCAAESSDCWQVELENIIKSNGYHKECGDRTAAAEAVGGTCIAGVVIVPKGDIEVMQGNKIVYNVYTYADWNMGTLTKILALGGKKENPEDEQFGTWKISGTARLYIREEEGVEE